MTLPRSAQIDPGTTPYYHCVSRCVRRAFLCGRDEMTGFNFEHRRAWIEQRLQNLAEIFAIDLCAYAVMSNHYHVVLHINADRIRRWTSDEVVMRWARLHQLPAEFDVMDSATKDRLTACWRERLNSISWFMKCVNEPLARLANKEDGCKGRFWEGRFKSQALLDEVSVLKCMAYVDLNPVRAALADRPETSIHTSVKARIDGTDQALAPMRQRSSNRKRRFELPISRLDYLSLVDITGRQLRADKSGRIDSSLPKILLRLERASTRDWLDEMRDLSRHYSRAIGTRLSLIDFRTRLRQKRLNGLTAS